MRQEQIFRHIGSVLANIFAIALAVAPIIADKFLHDLGPDPEKRISILQSAFNQPLYDLNSLGSFEKVRLTLGQREFSNLYIANVTLTNVGPSPILPADFHEPLSVSVDGPWEIVAVKNGRQMNQQVFMQWNIANPQKHVAERSLMNPGDVISAVVYLTNGTLPQLSTVEATKQPTLKWNARITNMKAFSNEEDRINKMWLSIFDTFTASGIYTILAGKKLALTFVAAIANMALLIHLFARAKLIQRYNIKMLTIILTTATLSASVGECLATYICGDIITNIINAVSSLHGEEPIKVSFINAPPLILNSLLILSLLNWSLLKRTWTKFRKNYIKPVEC